MFYGQHFVHKIKDCSITSFFWLSAHSWIYGCDTRLRLCFHLKNPDLHVDRAVLQSVYNETNIGLCLCVCVHVLQWLQFTLIVCTNLFENQIVLSNTCYPNTFYSNTLHCYKVVRNGQREISIMKTKSQSITAISFFHYPQSSHQNPQTPMPENHWLC